MTPRPVLLVDLDGTITDSLPGIERSLMQALSEIGHSWPADRDVRTAVGPPIIDTLATLGITGDTAQEGLLAYRRRYTSVGWKENSVYPGMGELLAGLAAEGYRMAVATSKPEVQARTILDHFELSRYFEFVGGADPATDRNAKADVIAHSLRALGIDPVPAADGGTEGVLMIGDRSHDIEGSAHYGIPCCVVTWGYGSEQEWHSARWSADTTERLRAVIEGW